MQLLIVESPTKSKTLSRFLGNDFLVASSYGHVRDLPKTTLGVDVEKDFTPKYIVPAKAKPKIAEIKEMLKKTKTAILATDEDREGEAIAWHLAAILNLKNPKRIVFHEITKTAIENALKHPRDIDMNLVDSQQARRILDRLVGYKLSPFLWKKIMRGLSAGRVQSVAVRLICEREKEINNFKKQEYWTVEALLQPQILNPKSETLNKSQILSPKSQTEFKTILTKKDGKAIDKLEIKNKEEADKILQDLGGAEYKVQSIEKKEIKRNPLPPFITSTLQQEAWARFRFTAQRTMSTAQKLYETGLITYHRTDSTNIAPESQTQAKDFIINNFGQDYWSGFARVFKTKSKNAQEAHEAIRPTHIENRHENLKQKEKISPEQIKLYDLIWRRFLASQMKEARFDSTKIEIEAKNYTFTATGQILKFDGFLKVYPLKFEEAELPKLEKNEILELKELLASQHFTQPPARYSEATLIKALEKEGIGRPSTYAPILDTIQKRNYTEKDENKRLKPTEIGAIVNDVLVEHFPTVVDIQFTAKMEKELDEIAEGKDSLVRTLKDFYGPFSENLQKKEKEVVKKDTTEKTDKICPECQNPLIIRLGKYGKFLACSAFPKCKHTENLPKEPLNIVCPKCGQAQLVEKHTKKAKVFYGCPNWPDCDFALWDKPLSEKCPKCGSLLIQTKTGKIKCSKKECKFKKQPASATI